MRPSPSGFGLWFTRLRGRVHRRIQNWRDAPRPRFPCLALFIGAAAGITLGHLSTQIGGSLADFPGASLGESPGGSPSLWVPLAWALAAASTLTWSVFRSHSLPFWLGLGCFFAALQSSHTAWAPGRLLLHRLEILSAATNHPPTPHSFHARARVLEPPQSQGEGWAFRAAVESATTAHGPAPEWPIKVLVRWPGPAPSYGDTIVAHGSLHPIPPPRNPGEFDKASWLAREGIWVEWRVPPEGEPHIVGSGATNPFLALAWAARARAQTILASGLEDFPSIEALLKAMTLGDASALTPLQLEAFRETGTLHLFSVSGLHVAMMAVIFWFALKLLRLPFPVQVITVIALLFFYAAVTGWGPASVRAAFMASVVLMGWLLYRPSTPINSLAAAGFILLLGTPPLLFHPGFQLSFLVVFSILLLGAPSARWLKEHAGPDPLLPRQLYGWPQRLHAWGAQQFAALAAISWSAWLGSFPLIVLNYHLISFSALLVNLWAVPLSFGVLALAMLSLATGWVSLGLASIFNHANVLCAGLLLESTLAAAQVPGGSWRFTFTPPPEVGAMILDLGRGGSNVLRVHGATYLLDTGSAAAWERTVRPYLETGATHRLQGILLTHGDAAHLGGARLAVESLPPAWVAVGALPERSRTWREFVAWMQNEAATSTAMERVSAGAFWTLPGSGRLEILAPPAQWSAARADDRALVVRWKSPQWSMLFLGDAGIAVQDWLLAQEEEMDSTDVLVLGRPDSGEVPRQEFLRRLAPRVIIVSAADFPPKERFTPLWDAALRSTGAIVFRQDHTGAVSIWENNQHIEVRGFLPPHQETSWRLGSPK